MNTFSPMVHHSPHYRYHGAIWQARTLERMWDLDLFTPQAKRQMAKDILALWSSGEGDWPASRYLDKLGAKFEPILEGKEVLIDVDDLPK